MGALNPQFLNELIQSLDPILSFQEWTTAPELENLPKEMRLLIIVEGQMPLSEVNVFTAGYLAGSSNWCGVWGGPLKGLPLKSFQDMNALCLAINEQVSYWKREQEILKIQRQIEKKGREFCRTDFIMAVDEGDGETVAWYLQAGFPASLHNKKGVCLLSIAIRRKHTSLVDMLLEHGAEINAISRDRNNTPLMDAASEGLPELTQKLLIHGAEIEIASVNGQTALALAVGSGDEDSALYLLEAGANPDRGDALGMTPRTYASLFGRKRVLEKLS